MSGPGDPLASCHGHMDHYYQLGGPYQTYFGIFPTLFSKIPQFPQDIFTFYCNGEL